MRNLNRREFVIGTTTMAGAAISLPIATERTLAQEDRHLPSGYALVASLRLPLIGIGGGDLEPLINGSVKDWCDIGCPIRVTPVPMAIDGIVPAGLNPEQTVSDYGELAAALALLSHADKGDAGNQVRMMTLHSAKGLEFRFVFIIGVEDGNLPHEASIEESGLDEERRLLYVGITRAKQQLWLSHASTAQRWGDKLRLSPSRFLDELPAAELQRDGADPVADAALKAERRDAGLANIRAMLAD